MLAAIVAALGVGVAPSWTRAQVAPAAPRARASTRDAQREAQRAQLLRHIDAIQRRLADQTLAAVERERLTESLANAAMQLAMLESRESPGPLQLQLQGQTDEAQRALEHARHMMEQQGMRERWFPRGWLGINVVASGASERIQDGDHFIRFFDYPRVVSVDPSSPAERAGIRSGDTLVGYGDLDVRQEIAMNRLLVPDTRLEIRVRRDGSVLTLPVRVARAPRAIMRRRLDLSLPAIPEAAPAPPGASTLMRLPAAAMPAPAPGAPPMMLQFDRDALLGARVTTVTPALSEATGIARGVLVLEVIPGSPAQESGLHAGDIVVRAGGPVSDLADIQRAIARQADRALPLEVRRRGVTRKLVLRW